MEVHPAKYKDAKNKDFGKLLQSGIQQLISFLTLRKAAFPCFNSSTLTIVSIL